MKCRKMKFGLMGLKQVFGSVLLFLLSGLFSLLLSLPVSAVQQVSFSSGISYDGWYSGFDAGQTTRVLPATYTRTNAQLVYLTPTTLSSDEFANEKDVVLSGSIMFNVNYITTATPRPVVLSCPVFNSWILTTNSDCDTVEVVYGNSHYLIYNFVVEGVFRQASQITSSRTIVLQFDIKNNSADDANMWFFPVIVTAGGGEYNRLVGINTSIDNVIGTLGVINNNLISQTNIVSQLNTSVTNLYNRLGSVETKLDTLNSSVLSQGQATQQAITDQTEQQEEQYEQEKQEEADREEALDGNSSALSGAFHFTVANPFTNLVALFTEGSACVGIPNFARLVGSTETSFCPWFPAWVRNLLTPVITLISSFFLFRYIWRWLGSDSEKEVELG